MAITAAAAIASCTVPEFSGFGDQPGNDASTGGTAGVDGSAGSGGGGTDAGPDAPVDGGNACKTNADCTATPATPVCEPTSGNCVECLPTDDTCPAGTYCKGTTCTIGCTADTDCVPQGGGGTGGTAGSDAGGVDAGPNDASASDASSTDGGGTGGAGAAGSGGATADGGTLKCDTSKNLCVGCLADPDCPLGTVCDVAASTCIPGCVASSTCPSGFDCCAKECVNTATNTSHCGACDALCDPPGGTGKCEQGACKVNTCDPGLADCNGKADDGCETIPASDPLHCGGCGKPCAPLPNAQAACTSGSCSLGPCNSGFENCDNQPANGCEVNLQTSVGNCGSCGLVCDLLNTNEVCTAGACGIGTCSAGFADCDNTTSTGCETNILTSTAHCGTCGNACSFPNGTGTCTSGTCQLSGCAAPNADCNLVASDGCEVNTNTNVSHCGGCGKACSLPNATAACQAGACAVGSCNGAFADCNNVPTDGCEINTNTSTSHCGACGKVCSSNNGTPGCSSGNCTISCTGSFANCDNNVANGCEVNTNTNVNHCGACGNVCPSPGGATPNCVNGVCGISSCVPPTADCDGNAGNGCEVNTSNNTSHCGACGNACFVANGSASCNSGSCAVASCNSGFSNCDGLYSNGCEKNLNTDPLNCGTCGKVCSSNNGTPGCSAGTCTISCTAGFANCDNNVTNGCEVPLNTTSNCGACGVTCTNANGSTSCQAGACKPTCAAGFGDCNGNPNDGCETPLNTLTNCGACGVACNLPNAVEACTTGTCQVTSCEPGFGNCNGQHADGCEVNINTTVAHCGGCGSACSNNNGGPSCSGGNCSIVCNSGFANCDGNARINGCEINLKTDPSNCNACGTVCPPATPNCSNGTCVSACPVGFADCDGNAANGCETNIQTNGNHCGACNNACTTSQYCNSASCTSCPGGQSDCDKNGANACEAATATDPSNCGGCGTTCGAEGTCGCTSSSCSGGTIYFSENFASAPGWTMTGEWAIGPTSTSTGHQQGGPDPANDHTTTSDNGVAGIVLGGNYTNVVHPADYLTSPVINLSSAPGTVKLTFWRWLNCDYDPYVTDTVEVFNGSSWVVIWTNASVGNNLITDIAWNRWEFDVTAYKNANFRVRFGHKVDKKGNFLAWIMSGWNIDDVSLSSGTCD